MAIACYLNLLSSSYTLSLIDLIIAMVLIHLYADNHKICISQFSSVQSLSCVQLLVTP